MANRGSIVFGNLPPVSRICTFDVAQVVQLLETSNLGECSEAFRKRQIDGTALLNLTDDKIMPWVGAGDIKITHIKRINNLIKAIKTAPVHPPKAAKPLIANRNFAPPPATRTPAPKPVTVTTRPPFQPNNLNLRPRPPITPPNPSFTNRPSSFLFKQAMSAKPEPPKRIPAEKIEEDQGETYEVPIVQPSVPPTLPPANVKSMNWPSFPAPAGPPRNQTTPIPLPSREQEEEQEIYSNLEDEQIYDIPSNIPVVFPVKPAPQLEEDDQYEVPNVPPSTHIQPMSTGDKSKGFMTALRSKLSLNNTTISERENKNRKTGYGSTKSQPLPTLPTTENPGLAYALRAALWQETRETGLPRPLPPLPLSPPDQDLVVPVIQPLSRCSSGGSFSSDPDLNSRGASVSPFRELGPQENHEADPIYENKTRFNPPPSLPLPLPPNESLPALPLPPTMNFNTVPKTVVAPLNIPSGSSPPSPQVSELSRQVWYRRMNRKDAERLLKGCGDDGRYLVRPSTHGGADSPYTLSLLHQGRVYHILVRRRSDGQFALGKVKEKEVVFTSVPALVVHYRTEPLQLQQQDGAPGQKACLTLPPP